MSKVHLQANAGNTREPMAMCATQYNAAGKIMDNRRSTYVGMTSAIVRLDALKATPAADRCAHCCDILLVRRNLQRKAKGKAPVKSYNEGWENG